MGDLHCSGGLRYNRRDSATGAQTGRRGGAGPAGGWLGGKDPTGRFRYRSLLRANSPLARRACEGQGRPTSLLIFKFVEVIRGTQKVPQDVLADVASLKGPRFLVEAEV